MSTFSIDNLAAVDPSIVCLGSHAGIMQSILDFDYMNNRAPSIKAIIGTSKKFERFFFGESEIVIPVYGSVAEVPQSVSARCTAILNLLSGRRVFPSSTTAMDTLPNAKILAVFAEEVPEQHAIALRKKCEQRNVVAIGPATVGLLIPGVMKLGAIGGTEYQQLVDSNLGVRGSIAVMSSSGGMTNELINIVAHQQLGVSFAVAFGGERFPMLTPLTAFLAAENDPHTKAIVYFGELGGTDEYEIAQAFENGTLSKPVIAYVAGRVAEMFPEPPQFGHAKALAQSYDETATAKKDALRKAGVTVADTFADFITAVDQLPEIDRVPRSDYPTMTKRTKALFVSSIANTDSKGELRLVGKTLHEIAGSSYGNVVGSLLLGHQPKSQHTEQLVELTLKLLVDHGPNVSGAVNTMVTASAGKDLVSSLAAGLLTIGPRFGGAVNDAASTLLRGVEEGMPADSLVEDMASKKILIPGIGHKKYNINLPDPRISSLTASLPEDSNKVFLSYARDIERITTKKGSSLILNVDGAIAACLLDVLYQYEDYEFKKLRGLINSEFFNALFVAARSVGFIAHYIDQRRLDEGLFRLSNDAVAHVSIDQ